MGKLTWAVIILLVFVAFPVLAVLTIGIMLAFIMGGGLLLGRVVAGQGALIAAVLASFDKYDQSVIYMGTEEYTKFIRDTYQSEKVTIERLGLAMKT